MVDKVKRAEIVVVAESLMGVELGVTRAVRLIMDHGKEYGEDVLPKMGVSVIKWNVFDVNVTTDIDSKTIIEPMAPEVSVPDIGAMDIEEAKGYVGVAKDTDELDALASIEMSSERVPGGRKGVLKFIAQRREEMLASARADKEE